jgi:sugar fermentation stimulation protein A
MTSDAPLLTIPHRTPLLPGRLQARYERFLAYIQLDDGREVTAHCVNPGRMEGLVRPGARVWVSEAPPGSKRKLAFTWELVELDGRIIGANTVVPNTIAQRLLEARVLPGFRKHRALQRERPYGQGSRVDFWLQEGRSEHFVEVKNCHLVYPDGRGYFPDSVSARATRHLEELEAVVREGHRASVLFTVQDERARAVRPSDLHDETFARAVRQAHESGVRFRAVRVRPTVEAYVVEASIPVDVKPYRTARMHAWKTENAPYSGWKRRPRKGRSGGEDTDGASPSRSDA